MSNQIDHQLICVGLQNRGKTTYLRTLCAELLSQGYWVFVHDIKGEFRDLCQFYLEVGDWWDARDEHAGAGGGLFSRGRDGTPMPRGAAIAAEVADQVIDLAWAVSAQTCSERVAFIVNEGSAIDESGTTWLSKRHNVLISQRRHHGPRGHQDGNGLALNVGVQSVRQLEQRWYGEATKVVCFQVHNKADIAYLERNANVEGLGEILPRLTEHSYIEFVPGSGRIVVHGATT